jgi:hypothetical protein
MALAAGGRSFELWGIVAVVKVLVDGIGDGLAPRVDAEGVDVVMLG